MIVSVQLHSFNPFEAPKRPERGPDGGLNASKYWV